MSRAYKMDVFLQPGEHYVGDAECRIRTVLGSCVSITLWHPSRRIGAMSHFLLSRHNGSADALELDGRYAEGAMLLMLRDLASQGVLPHACQAKLFGGGNMFPRQVRSSALDVGRRNGETARLLMRAYDIPILSESLFGIGYRQIIFDVATGHVWSRQIEPLDQALREIKGTG